jgi:hypothetical protein
MKSEASSAQHPEVFADDEIMAALSARAAGLQPGATVPLEGLPDLDPYGLEAFTKLAARYGLARDGRAAWCYARKPRWTPRWVGPRDEAQCLELFEAAFGYRIDPALWRWKYRDAAHPGMGVWRDGQLVAFYGAMPRRVLCFGRPVSAVQIGDVMVLPSERGVMTRTGPFQIAATTYFDRSLGYGRPHLLGFGFPTAKALAVARKLGLYEEVDQMAELSWPADEHWSARTLRCDAVRAQDKEAIQGLWEAMALESRDSILGTRDAEYIEQRYRKHPTVTYECLMVRRRLTGAVQGVMVLRSAGEGELELMDLIGPRRKFPALIAAARAWALRKGARRLRAWITASHAHELAATGAARTLLDLIVPTNVWSPGPPVDELRGRWWLTAGDTDFR